MVKFFLAIHCNQFLQLIHNKGGRIDRHNTAVQAVLNGV